MTFLFQKPYYFSHAKPFSNFKCSSANAFSQYSLVWRQLHGDSEQSMKNEARSHSPFIFARLSYTQHPTAQGCTHYKRWTDTSSSITRIYSLRQGSLLRILSLDDCKRYWSTTVLSYTLSYYPLPVYLFFLPNFWQAFVKAMATVLLFTKCHTDVPINLQLIIAAFYRRLTIGYRLASGHPPSSLCEC